VIEAVLDASALLAFLQKEPGRDRVAAVLGKSAMSAVNVAEVVTKGIDYGGTVEGISSVLTQLPLCIMPFAPEDAYLAASLRPATRAQGLSLGDRACLALALKLSAPALTTERDWQRCALGVEIVRIR
jgi:PIN domain nuclease of toxin-antitoxin system